MEPGTAEAIKEIRKWLIRENIPNVPEQTILKFLSGCEYQTDEARRKLKNFYEVRKTSPDLFQGRDPILKNLETLLDRGAFFPLPNKYNGGQTLILVKVGATDPKITPMTDLFKLGIMSVDLLMETDEGVIENGVSVIVDLKGVGIHHAMQMTPMLVRKVVHLWEDCYPVRISGIDFVSAPKGVHVVLNVFLRFLGENLRQRVRTHGNQMESLHSIIDRTLLPEEYGGSSGPEMAIIQEWKQKVQNYRHWFLNEIIT